MADNTHHVIAARLDKLTAERDAARAEVERLQSRLEIDYEYVLGEDGDLKRRVIPPERRAGAIDGIECRDATIALQDDVIAKLQRKLAKRTRQRDKWFKRAREFALDNSACFSDEPTWVCPACGAHGCGE